MILKKILTDPSEITEESHYKVYNETVDDRNLSYEQLGLFLYCSSFPEDHEFHLKDFITDKARRDKIYGMVNHLVAENYLEFVQVRDKRQRITRSYYCVSKSKMRELRREPNVEDKSGYVYLIQVKGQKSYKVGYSVNPQRRLQDLQDERDMSLILVAQISSTNMYRDETRWHEKFHRYQFSGEWFALPDSAVDNFIKASE